MATRIGKYKVSKRDSALSLSDGGTVEGAITITGAVTLSGLATSGINASSNQLFVTSSDYISGSAGSVAKNVVMIG
jgi:hypothetical protein|tara:strand:- start:732 stop:959 length:228 start_codon:yes stop_codon:yes gene_type:complete